MPTKTDNQCTSFNWRMTTVKDGKTTQDIQTTDKFSWVNSRTGVSLPNWRSLVKQGKNATTPYSCTFQEVKRLNVSSVLYLRGPNRPVKFQIQSLDGTPGSFMSGTTSPLGLDTSKTDRIARQNFIKHYRARRTAFQSGVALGELLETVHMIRHPAQALREGINQYYSDVKKRMRKYGRTNRTVRDTWLEYAFGWKPLIGDVQDAVSLATVEPFKAFEYLQGRDREDMSDVRVNNSYDYGIQRLRWTDVVKSYISVKYKGAIGYQNEAPGFPEQLGLSWSNVLPTIWELIPYSFLVDYFTNVGTVIDGISTGTTSLRWGVRTTWRKTERLMQALKLDLDFARATYNDPTDKVSGNAFGDGSSSTYSIFDRTFVDTVTVGLGDIRFRLPGTETKWLNIAALARLRS